MTYFINAMENAIKADNSPFRENAIALDLWEWAKEYEDDGAENLIAWSLEDCNCSGAHAPNGLIYNNEIAAKYVDWWNDIDAAMDEYFDATGERYAPETTGQLVWFAVEWFASELANFLRSNKDWDDWDAQANDPSEEDFSARFDAEIAPLVIEKYGPDDEPAMNEAFCNWVDDLQKNGEISEYFASIITR